MVGRSLARVEDAINHLREFSGPDKAIEIPSDRVTEYVAKRQDKKAAASTGKSDRACAVTIALRLTNRIPPIRTQNPRMSAML